MMKLTDDEEQPVAFGHFRVWRPCAEYHGFARAERRMHYKLENRMEQPVKGVEKNII